MLALIAWVRWLMEIRDQIRSILKEKGADVWSVHPSVSVYDAIATMSQKQVGALLVIEDRRLVGIVSERDYARKVILKGKASRETYVWEIMSQPVICVPPECTVEQTMAMMTEKRVRHLPVVENETVVGVISIGDVVRAIIEDKEYYIQQLTSYITACG
jgi:CBS domain-containing protein